MRITTNTTSWISFLAGGAMLALCACGRGGPGDANSSARFTVGGAVSGLSGTVVLQNNGGDNLSIKANGPFAFPGTLVTRNPYAITVLSQPTDQNCTVTNGIGAIASADVTNVIVSCATNTFLVGGTVQGLSGTVVLQNNGGDDLSLSADGGFIFHKPVATGGVYHVTILAQPASQTCVITNGQGTVAGANVTNVSVTCTTNAFTVGGTVSGLSGTVTLQDNGVDTLSISATGGFTFGTRVTQGSVYNVTVAIQPATQTCTVTNGTGTIVGANVTNVGVVCTPNTFTIGGTVSGLSGTVVLQNNNGDNLPISTSGGFTFATRVTTGSAYKVIVATQPATQTCAVANGAGIVGSADVINVVVTCATNTFTVGGTASGLSGTLILRNNGGDDLSISANGSFTFSAPIAQGGGYSVTVLTQPTGQTCTIANGSGTVGGANVTNVAVACTTNSFTVGGSISGLNGTVVLRNNGGDELAISTNGPFTFSTPVVQGSGYKVTILTQPTDQTCTVANGIGTIGSGNVTNVAVTCTTNSFTVGGSVSGLNGTVVLQNNGGDNLSISANGSFTFVTALVNNSPYAVTVLAQPATQTCTVADGAGVIAGANVTKVAVTCTTNTFVVGGTISGLNGTVVLQNNGADNLSVSANGGFAFATHVATGSAYNITVAIQPATQTCTVLNGTGTVAGANVTNVGVSCTTNTFTVGGSVSGLNGTVVLRNNGGDELSISTNGPFTFSTPVAQGSTFSVAVLTQPIGQTCAVANGAGTIGSSNVTNVAVTCTTDTFTVGGMVSGLSGTVVLQNNGGDDLSLSADGGFTFATALASNSPYAVTVFAQPSGQTCGVVNGTGTIVGANVTNVTVSCVATSSINITVSPKLAGLTTSQTQVLSAVVTNDPGGTGVSWTASGGSLANQTATSVTFSSSVAGIFTVTATSVADPTKSVSATVGVTDLAGVFTQHYDAQRTGQNRKEFALTPNTVTDSTFGKLFSCAVDGEVYAQPLYVANFAIAGGTHNVVLVATENDSVYAFDADARPCVQYWHTSFLGTGVTPVPPIDTEEGRDIDKNIGISGTPVIDPATGTLYVVAKTKETVGGGCSDVSPCYVQRLHALDLATGNEAFGGPANISPSITVSGSGDTGDSTCPSTTGVPFCPLRENQRPGLLLLNGKVYIAWGSHGDHEPYHGWVIGYDAADLTQAPVVFNTTPDGGMGGIWMSGSGPAADANGNIYVMSGNGSFDTSEPRTNYADSFIKLSSTAGPSVVDFFTPSNQSVLDRNDFDLGSGGAVVLPDSAGSQTHPHLLIGGDKQGILYVIDRDNMGGFQMFDQVVQEVSVTSGSPCITCGIFSTPAFWEGKLYIAPIGDVLKQYGFVNGALSELPAVQANEVFGFPGATPAVSADGATNGIVWVIDTTDNGTPNGSGVSAPAVLVAYDATTLNKLFSSPRSGTGAAGNAVKFVVPTIANAKVYVGTQTELTVFGLLP